MTEQMPKEQYEYIKRIQDDMLECTNMTENEAWDFAFRCWQCGYNKINKEIEQYRAIGTVEEIKKIISFLSIDNDNCLIDDMELLNQYRALGTVEELRVARDKQVAKKPVVKDVIFYCSNCGGVLYAEHYAIGFCGCGQKIKIFDDKEV